jgi:fructose-bisphosphate aldolase class II
VAIVGFNDLVRHAAGHRYALNILPVASLADLEAALAAGHRQRTPLLLAPAGGASHRNVAAALFAACEATARDTEIPVALISLQEATAEGAITAVKLGSGAIHVRPTTAAFSQVVAEIQALAEIIKPCGIGLGATVPDYAARESSQDGVVTACIALAQSTTLDFLEIGTKGDDGDKPRAQLDYGKLRRISEATGIPLLTRIAGEVRPDQVRRLIESGVALVHHVGDSRPDERLLAERFTLWGGAGRAADVLNLCRPLQPVAHVVEFNVPATALAGLEAILQTGRRRLATIPGVRSVATGEAVADNARYRYCWIVTFANEHVVRYYRDHPIHIEFADHYFRPIAEDRLTIDFRLTGG